ncbi:MAG: SRPBCC family protein [Acidobacteriaceae bacterium]|jgi:ligand-binding SRPBCC domain-containing protein
MRHRFQTEQWVPYPRERVFAFFSDPANLPPLMPGWQHARVERVARPLLSPASIAAGEGSLITISFRAIPWVPVRLEWDAYIAEFHWNESFCDEQRRGPFKYFRHCHRIWDEANGSVVSDTIEYELPLGMLGELANGLAVKRQIRALFRYRQKMLPDLLARG